MLHLFFGQWVTDILESGTCTMMHGQQHGQSVYALRTFLNESNHRTFVNVLVVTGTTLKTKSTTNVMLSFKNVKCF